MSYIKDFEAQLKAKLESGAEDAAMIIRWASEKVVESFINGVKAGNEAMQRIHDGKGHRASDEKAK
jgi:hypothetical protein